MAPIPLFHRLPEFGTQVPKNIVFHMCYVRRLIDKKGLLLSGVTSSWREETLAHAFSSRYSA